ncbi:MAG TPA: ATP-binding protein [Mycobacteriales bacterium]|nr:ATP-binding protein [Mycobacteriales bacterium]
MTAATPVPRTHTTAATRILLADDSDGLRLLVRSWLSTVDDLEVVAEASNGAEAVALADAHRPDVVVLDVAMPVMDGLEALSELHRRFPSLPVVMLSGFAERDVADQATRRGAYAFVEKTGDLDPLVEVVRRAALGPRLAPPPRTEQAARATDAAPAAAVVPVAEPLAGAAPNALPVPPREDPSSPARSWPDAVRAWLPTLLALAAFPALLAVRLQVDDARSPVLLLLAVPVLVLGVRHGRATGLLAGLAASALYTAWASTVPDVRFGDLDHLARYVVFLTVGTVAGAAFDRLRRSNTRQQQISDAVVASNRRLVEANEQLSLLNAELESSNADLRQFGYVASHDLAEPLRTMSSFAGLLERRCADALDADGRQYVRFIADGAERMQSLIGDLRDYTRTSAAELVLRPVDLDDVAGDVRDALRATLEARAAELRTGPLPVVAGDRSMLGLVLQNLVANAVKFNESEPPVVEISAELRGSSWCIEVSDNGIGIDPAGVERAFGLFTRLQPREAYAGTGLGLAIAKRIVERHRGSITMAPRDGGGTVVTVVLPDLVRSSAR